MCRWRLLKSESETIPNRLRCCRRAQKKKKKTKKNENKLRYATFVSILGTRIVFMRSSTRLFVLLLFFYHRDLFPAQLAGAFLNDRPPGQAVVTAVALSSLRYTPSFMSRMEFSIPTACRFSSIVANSRSRAYRNDHTPLGTSEGTQRRREEEWAVGVHRSFWPCFSHTVGGPQ